MQICRSSQEAAGFILAFLVQPEHFTTEVLSKQHHKMHACLARLVNSLQIPAAPPASHAQLDTFRTVRTAPSARHAFLEAFPIQIHQNLAHHVLQDHFLQQRLRPYVFSAAVALTQTKLQAQHVFSVPGVLLQTQPTDHACHACLAFFLKIMQAQHAHHALLVHL
jgi:hypothetical protein